jgi:hypothetical protein
MQRGFDALNLRKMHILSSIGLLMAMPVSSYDDFERKFRHLRGNADLFGFLLFDDRPSHRVVSKFAEDNFPWLDQLAGAANMFFFVCIRENEYAILESPSLEVAKLFGILPRQLPGVVLFNFDDDNDRVSNGIFLPIAAKLFDEDSDHVEEVIANLFSLIDASRRESATPSELLYRIAQKLNTLSDREKRRLFIQYLKSVAQKLSDLPSNFAAAAAEAIVKSTF